MKSKRRDLFYLLNIETNIYTLYVFLTVYRAVFVFLNTMCILWTRAQLNFLYIRLLIICLLIIYIFQRKDRGRLDALLFL